MKCSRLLSQAVPLEFNVSLSLSLPPFSSLSSLILSITVPANLPYSLHTILQVWILFRHSVDVILLNDFLSYLLFTLTYLTFPGPPSHSITFHALRWIGGVLMLLFNLWVKVDAHKIVKDYAYVFLFHFFLSFSSTLGRETGLIRMVLSEI